MLTESVLLAMLAGVAATLVAAWGGVVLRRIFLPDIHWSQVPLDWRVLVAAGLATLAAGLVAGAIPAVQSGATELTDSLKAGARESHVRPGRIRGIVRVTIAPRPPLAQVEKRLSSGIVKSAEASG